MTPRTKSTTAQPKAQKKKRVRLAPEVRRQQILDAALVEFSALGFTAASIAKIARRAGTSKANLYVHFVNKDEIFEALLRNLLTPSEGMWPSAQADQDLPGQIDAWVEDRYSRLTPQVIAVIRLLISESHRIPDLIRRWHEQTMMPARAEKQRRIDRLVAENRLGSTPLADYFVFFDAPVLYAAVTRMIFSPEVAESECRKIKEADRKLLHFLLKS